METMTQEDKDLLLKDLCARLPYGVKMTHIADDKHCPKTLIGIAKDMITLEGIGGYECVDIEDYKPYLFPISSMTEEQKREYNSLRDFVPTYHYEYGDIVEDIELYDNWESIDYLIANHFDYRGLIEKGLANDATGLGIYEDR